MDSNNKIFHQKETSVTTFNNNDLQKLRYLHTANKYGKIDVEILTWSYMIFINFAWKYEIQILNQWCQWN